MHRIDSVGLGDESQGPPGGGIPGQVESEDARGVAGVRPGPVLIPVGMPVAIRILDGMAGRIDMEILATVKPILSKVG